MAIDLTAIAGPIVGAVLGGGLTYLGTAGIQRARPKLALQGCTINSDQALSDEAANINSSLLLQCETTAELQPYIDRDERIVESDYIEFLQKADADLRLHIERRPEFQRTTEQLQRYLTAGQWDEFEQLWADQNYVLWQPLINAFSRGQVRFATRKLHPGSDGVGQRIRESNGSVRLHIERGRRIEFWYETGDTDQQAFSLRAAMSMASHDPEDVQLLLNNLASYAGERHLLDLQAAVSSELKKFARVVITGHLVNTGRLPCSVMNRVRLFILSSGTLLAQQKNDSPSKPATRTNDLEVELFFGAAYDGVVTFSAPVTVPPGGLVPFVAMSHQPLSTLPDGADIAQLLAAGSTTAYLGYQVSRAGRSRLVAEYSPNFDFIDSGDLMDIPSRKPRRPRTIRK